MNWEAIGVIAELVSAAAVVATLIYLIAEVRQSRLATESASVDLLAVGWNTLNGHIIDDPDLSHQFLSGLADPESLDQPQKDRLFMIFQSYINHFTTIKKDYDAGHLPEELWEYHAAGISVLANSPGGKWACERAAIIPSIREVFSFYEDKLNDDYLQVLDKRGSP